MSQKIQFVLFIFISFLLLIVTGLTVYVLVNLTNIRNEVNDLKESINIGACNSNDEIQGDDKESVTLKCGDKLILTVGFKASTGYSPYPPVFDSTIFELLESPEDSNTYNGMPGGDNSTRTFIFRSLKDTVSSDIEVGTYRSFDPENTKMIKQSISVSVEP